MTDTSDRLYERVLVLRCQAGDEAAFTELVERIQPGLRYYLCKMLHDAQDAEDTLQDVWLDVFHSVSRLADAGAFRAWLYRIARDRALRLLRVCRPRSQRLEDDATAGDGDEEDFTAEDAKRIHVA